MYIYTPVNLDMIYNILYQLSQVCKSGKNNFKN